MPRSYKSNDARNFEESPEKAAAAPVLVEAVVKAAQPQESCTFQIGDIVSFRSNTRGTVLAVTGDGVQVDFGLGSGWFSKHTLTLVKTASVLK